MYCFNEKWDRWSRDSRPKLRWFSIQEMKKSVTTHTRYTISLYCFHTKTDSSIRPLIICRIALVFMSTKCDLRKKESSYLTQYRGHNSLKTVVFCFHIKKLIPLEVFVIALMMAGRLDRNVWLYRSFTEVIHLLASCVCVDYKAIGHERRKRIFYRNEA